MRGPITDSAAPGGLRLADDLAEPEPAPGECVIAVRAFSINYGETLLIRERPDGWRPGQDVVGVVVSQAADGSGPPEGTRVAAYLDWEGWAERVTAPARAVAAPDHRVSFEQAATRPVAGLTALRALREGGAILDPASQISIGDFYRQAWNARIIGFISPVPEETKGEDLAILAGLVADRHLRPRISLTLEWEKTAEALAALNRRDVGGKAVLTI
jgi:NADPH:quinone reductase-like Zn-dependent oxidoreductase